MLRGRTSGSHYYAANIVRLLEIMLISTYPPPSTNTNNNLSLKLCIQPFLGTRRTEKVEQGKLIKHINLSPYLHPFLPLYSPFFEVEEENIISKKVVFYFI